VDVADELGGGVDVAAGGDGGEDAAVGADHETKYRCYGAARTAMGFAWRCGEWGRVEMGGGSRVVRLGRAHRMGGRGVSSWGDDSGGVGGGQFRRVGAIFLVRKRGSRDMLIR
jgi:hypothetical protein